GWLVQNRPTVRHRPPHPLDVLLHRPAGRVPDRPRRPGRHRVRPAVRRPAVLLRHPARVRPRAGRPAVRHPGPGDRAAADRRGGRHGPHPGEPAAGALDRRRRPAGERRYPRRAGPALVRARRVQHARPARRPARQRDAAEHEQPRGGRVRPAHRRDLRQRDARAVQPDPGVPARRRPHLPRDARVLHAPPEGHPDRRHGRAVRGRHPGRVRAAERPDHAGDHRVLHLHGCGRRVGRRPGRDRAGHPPGRRRVQQDRDPVDDRPPGQPR
ncbi:MAG: Putative zinc metalloprotease MJ0392, partial [uncultured Phycisphaerae bacterium]